MRQHATERPSGFGDARASAERAEAAQRVQAARLVAGRSLDVEDCRELLSMLGLAASTPAHGPSLRPRARDQRQTNPDRVAPGAFQPAEGTRA
jgi:hypothetical protein